MFSTANFVGDAKNCLLLVLSFLKFLCLKIPLFKHLLCSVERHNLYCHRKTRICTCILHRKQNFSLFNEKIPPGYQVLVSFFVLEKKTLTKFFMLAFLREETKFIMSNEQRPPLSRKLFTFSLVDRRV